MKPNRLVVLLAGLLEFSTAARAQNLAAVFTNTSPAARMVLPRRTSIIFIQCHGLGYGDLSCYGQTNFQTPNLDRLAAEGIRFTRYAGGGDSATTTEMLLAGKNVAPAADEPNLTQRLQQSSYHTGLIGEWNLAGKPWQVGFDEFAGFLTDAEAKDYYADHLWRYPHTIYDESNRVQNVILDHEMLYNNMGGKKGQYLPELLVNAMNNFIRINQPAAANHYKPFFLLVNLPVPRTATTGKDDFPVPSDAPFTGEAWPQAAKDRAALITRLDNGIGRLFEQLGKLGMSNNVAIFFTSSSAPEKFASTNLDFLHPNGNAGSEKIPGTAPLPMMVRWLQNVPSGKVSDLNWSASDFAPTALEIAFVRPLPKLDGASILPDLRGRKPVKPETKP
jgi:arylsulfatase A-like enzyme